MKADGNEIDFPEMTIFVDVDREVIEGVEKGEIGTIVLDINDEELFEQDFS